MSKGLGEQLTYSGSSLDARETIILQEEQTIDNAITNISNAYPGLRVKVIKRLEKSDFTGELLSFKIYEIKKTSNRNKPLPADQGGYELIQEPKDLKYSDGTLFLDENGNINSDPTIDPLPSHSSSDNGKVLGLDNNGNPTWVSQPDTSVKIDKVLDANGNLPKLDSNGNLVDSGISASSVLTQHQNISGKADKVTGSNLTNKLVTLDEDGNIQDGGITLNALRGELDGEYVQKPSTNPTDGQILSYDETDRTKWVDNTTVHIKYAATDTPTSNDMHDSIQPLDLYIGIYSDNNFSDSTSYTDYKWSRIVGIDGTNGKSAYQAAIDAGQTIAPTEAQWVQELKANFGEYLSADYGTNGYPASGGSDIVAADAEHDKIYIVPNDPTTPTANIMFVSVSNGNNGYTWINLGEVNVSGKFNSGQNLDDVSIVQDLETGGADKVPSAAVVKELNEKLYGRVDESVKSDTDYASSIASGNIALNIDTTGLTRGGDNARCGDVLIDNIGNYAKLRIKGYSSRSSRLIFVKKDVRSLPSGTYDFQYLKDEYLCEEATADSYVVTIPSLTSTPEGVVVNIPQDATRVVIQCKRTDKFDNYPSSVVPFGVAVKGDIETMIDEKLEDFTPVTVEDTLESDSTEDALSANQGRVLAGQLTKMREVIVFKLMTYTIATSGNVWGTDIHYAHAMVPVKEGEKYRLYNRGTSNNIRYALLTSDECTAGGAMPLVDGTQVDTVNGGSYHDIVIPSGCRYLTFTEDKPGYFSYEPKLYRVLTLADKEFYEDDMEFGVTLPVDALAYHEGWNELVDAGIVTRSNPTYMNWDSEQEYPLYTYRIKRHTDWMKSSYVPQDSTATPTDTVKIVDELHLDEGQPTTYSPADDVPNPNYYRRKIMVTCGVHGSERLTPNTFLKWVKKHINDDIFAEFDFVIIPLCNPWGYSHSLLYNGSQSYNRMTYTNPTSDSAYTIVKNTAENGYYYGIRRTTTNTDNNHLVDINRDFLDDDEGATANGEATKFVTQEAQYIRDVYIAERPDMVIDFHQDINSTDNGVGFDKKCGFVSFGASNVQAIKDKLIECRRKAYTQTNKACYMTDNKYSVGREQYSYTWGGRYPNSESSWETVHQSNWKNYASGGSGNALHKDCAVRYSFTFETDVYCRKLNGTNSPNNRTAKQYGYEFMTKFLKYIFGVWDMGDCERHVYTISNT